METHKVFKTKNMFTSRRSENPRYHRPPRAAPSCETKGGPLKATTTFQVRINPSRPFPALVVRAWGTTVLYLVPLVLSYKLLIGGAKRVLIVKPDRQLIEAGPRDGVPSDQQFENLFLCYSVVILLAVR
jgi:hypothetical protein